MDQDSGVKLVVQALLEVVESGSKNMEFAVMKDRKGVEMLSADALKVLVEAIEKEKEKEAEKKQPSKK